MKLSSKVFWYSSILTTLFIIAWFLYMFLMLPGLHRNTVTKEREQNMITILKSYQNNDACTSEKSSMLYETIYIPKNGNTVELCGAYGHQQVSLISDRAKQVISPLRQLEKIDDKTGELFNKISRDENFKAIFEDVGKGNKDFSISSLNQKSTYFTDANQGEQSFNLVSDKLFVSTISVKSDTNDYFTNFLGMTLSDSGLFISFAPSTIVDTTSILPTVIESAPMFIVTAGLFLLISTALFSRRLALPIEAIAKRANDLKQGIKSNPVTYKGNDAIKQLSVSVDEMYAEINRNFELMKEKKEQLEIEKSRQHAFLMATSHELKTPIATSRLLVEGMIDQVEPFNEHTKYLPEVNKELQRMQHIVSKLLEAYEIAISVDDEVCVKEHIEMVIKRYHYLMAQRNLKIEYVVLDAKILHNTSEELLITIFDNLISNAIRYAKENTTITIQIDVDMITFHNKSEALADSTLKKLGRKVVESTHQDGSGVGLYLSAQYCRILGMKLIVENNEDGVIQKIEY